MTKDTPAPSLSLTNTPMPPPIQPRSVQNGLLHCPAIHCRPSKQTPISARYSPMQFAAMHWQSCKCCCAKRVVTAQHRPRHRTLWQ
jgi:hypothetical protein